MITLAGTVLAIDRYFAKKTSVDAMAKQMDTSIDIITERMDIGITDDQIFRQQQVIRKWEVNAKFEKRKDGPTDIEHEIIEQEKVRLSQLQQQRREKIERYKSKK